MPGTLRFTDDGYSRKQNRLKRIPPSWSLQCNGSKINKQMICYKMENQSREEAKKGITRRVAIGNCCPGKTSLKTRRFSNKLKEGERSHVDIWRMGSPGGQNNKTPTGGVGLVGSGRVKRPGRLGRAVAKGTGEGVGSQAVEKPQPNGSTTVIT